LEAAPEPPQASTFRVAGPGTSYLGVNLREVDSDRAKELKLKEEAGVEITRVEDDSPAAKAGLKVNDVVLTYNGTRVEGMEQFSRFVRETPPGRDVKLLISRDGNTLTLTARIGARKGPVVISGMPLPRMEMPAMPAMPAMAPMPDLPRAIMMWRTSSLGIEAEALRGQLADFFGVKDGVLVRSVMKDTAAAKAGLKAGDVIVKVGDANVASPADVTSAIHSAKDKKSLPIVVMRDHKEVTLTASIDEDRSDWDWPARRPISAR
jgi:serine protease Do